MDVQARRRLSFLLSWLNLLYLCCVLGTWGVISLLGDRWWPATFLLFGPRWVLLLPLMGLLPASLWLNRRMLIPLVLGGVIVAGPLMGLSVPHGRAGSSLKPALRVLTCNLQSGMFNLPALEKVVGDTDADLIALQECPSEVDLRIPDGWQVARDGGLMILSRYPLRRGGSMKSLHPPHKWPRTCLFYCTVRAPFGDVTVCTVHLPSPRYGLQSLLDRQTGLNLSRRGVLIGETAHRRTTALDVAGMISSLPDPVIIAGDFNMPQDSAIYRAAWGAYGNAFSQVGCGYGWTQFTGVRGIVSGVRIDHVLATPDIGFRRCETMLDVGSDHLPLFAEIVKR